MAHNNRESVSISVFVILGVLVIGGLVFSLSRPSGKDVMMEQKESMANGETMMVDTIMPAKDVMMDGGMAATGTMEKGGMMKENSMIMEQVMHKGAVLAGKSSPLLDFTKADYDTALTSGRLVTLFFYANWCPLCKAEFPKMMEVFNEYTGSDVIGFRVNYKDTGTDSDEKALAAQYGVAYQHTKVFIKNGVQILKAPDTWDKARYTTEIMKHR